MLVEDCKEFEKNSSLEHFSMDKAVLALEGDTMQNCRQEQMWELFFAGLFQKAKGFQPNCPATAVSKNTQGKHSSAGNLFTSSFKVMQPENGDRPIWKYLRNSMTVLSISIHNHTC